MNGANLSAHIVNPAIGYKLKVRITTVTTNVLAITYLRIMTATTAAAQSQNLYPLDTVSLTINGFQTGSDVVIYAAGTTTILDSVDAFAGTSWNYVYETPQPIDIGLFIPGYVPYYIRNFTLGLADASVPMGQTPDRNYRP
jgi:hypothetical protein